MRIDVRHRRRLAAFAGMLATAHLAGAPPTALDAPPPEAPAGWATRAATSEPAPPPQTDPNAARRGPARRRAIERFGGNRRTERAVADGLAWLAAHQRIDGVWDRVNFQRLCPADDRCSCAALVQADTDANVGTTALATLAFLGAGHTHRDGEHAARVERALTALLAQQRPSGSFAPDSPVQVYDDALATLAIAEASMLTRDPVFRVPLERGVRHLERAQQAAGGWDYVADPRTGRNDTSITGWVLMAFKAAAAAGFPPSLDTRWRLLAHFDRATRADGRVWYSDEGTGVVIDRATGAPTQRFGPAMTAVGLYGRGALGLRLDVTPARRQMDLLRGDLPELDRMMRGDPAELHNEYYWYYGTLALFNVGGEPWTEWNRALRNSVLEYQEHPVRRDGTQRHAYGSWPAYGRGWGRWGRAGGRVYSTALNVLTLEIYYRYVPAFMAPSGLLGPAELRARVAANGPARSRESLALCKRFHPDAAEPVFLDLLGSADADARLDAALALGELGSPLADAELRRRRPRAADELRKRIDAALGRIAPAARRGPLGRLTAINADARMVLFAARERPVYYGQRVAVVRDGRAIAELRIERRFTAEQAAAGRIVQQALAPRIGDEVHALEVGNVPPGSE